MSENTLSTPEIGLGGQGEGLSRSDLRMIERAIKNEWPIAEDKRARLIEEMYEILTDKEEDSRARVSAARNLINADSLNAQRERMFVPVYNAHIHSHQHDGDVKIVVKEDEDWYRNRAHRLQGNHAAGSVESPIADPASPGEVQGGGVRPEMGQDSDGDADDPPGSRA